MTKGPQGGALLDGTRDCLTEGKELAKGEEKLARLQERKSLAFSLKIKR